MGSIPPWGSFAVRYPPQVPPASLGQWRGRAIRWPLPWHGCCQASGHGGNGMVTVPGPAAGRAGDAQREAWERRDLRAPASALPDSPRAAGQAAPQLFSTAASYPHPRAETSKAAEPLSAGGSREGLRGARVLPPPRDPRVGVLHGLCRAGWSWGEGGAGADANKHAVLPLGTYCINRRFARAARNVRAGAGSTWCGQGGPDPCAGWGVGGGALSDPGPCRPLWLAGGKDAAADPAGKWGTGVLERGNPSLTSPTWRLQPVP